MHEKPVPIFTARTARLAALFALALIALASQPCAAQSPGVTVTLSDSGPDIGNSFITRIFMIRSRWSGTWALTNKIANETLPPSVEEFAFTLTDGTRVSSNDFKYIGRIDEHLDGDGRRLILTFRHNKLGVDAQAAYTLFPNDFFMRKTISLRCDAGRSVHIDSLVVEHFSGIIQTMGGGLGQPVFMDEHMFAGLEHPAGRSVRQDTDVLLMHNPGWNLGPDWRQSFSAVIGAAPKGRGAVRQMFTLYLHTIRRPPNPVTVYNSWYDVRAAGMDADRFLSVYKTIDQNLGRFGAHLDAVVVDDGWQDLDTLWETSTESFPNGMAPLGEALRSEGGDLGLWLPLCGHTLRLPFQKNVPCEVSPEGHYFCMSGPKYNAALRTRLGELIQKAGVRYFKHDFNYFDCTGQGPGYKPTHAQSFEDNAGAMAGLLDFMHEADPSVFSNITSHMWLSPWWLAHADTVWIGSADYGWNRTVPAIEPRDRSITYYDAHIYDLLVRREQMFPPYALMTHGIIDGQLNRLGGEHEPFNTWTDNVMMYLGRGVQMRELYITPSLLDHAKWKTLARGLRWAKSKDGVFSFYGHMIGGDPGRGDAYGYEFFNDSSEVVVMRNPGYKPQHMNLQLAYPKNLLRIVYPYHMWHDQLVIDRQGRFRFPLGEHQVVIMESVPESTLERPVLRGVRTRTIREDQTETEYEIRTFPGSLRFFISSPVAVHEVSQEGHILEPSPSGAYHGETAGGEHFFLNPPLVALSETTIADGAANMELRLLARDDIRDPEFVLYLSSNSDEFLPAQLEFDGRTATATITGDGWTAFHMPIEYGSHTHLLRIRAQDIMATPFASAGFAVTSFAGGWYSGVTSRVIVKHDPAPPSDDILPDPITQDSFRIMDLNINGRSYNMEQEMPPRTFGDIKQIRAAKLRIRVFGNRGGTPAPIMLNGTPVASAPGNNFPFLQWETFVIDIPEAQLGSIKKNNKIVILAMDKRAFNVKDIGLSVQDNGGLWLNSNLFSDVLTTNPDWEYSEGESFTGRSPAIRLAFP
jgi:hypothetical protein